MSFEDTIAQADAGRFFDDATKERPAARAAAMRALAPPRGVLLRRLDEDLAALCSSLSLSAERPVHVTLAADPIVMTARWSWRASLIAWELMADAARRAGSKACDGWIDVSAHVLEDMLLIAVLTNSPVDGASCFGGERITADALAADLGGTIVRRRTERGCCALFSVSIPDARAV